MNNEQKQSLVKIYGALGIAYGRGLTTESVIIMVNALDDLPFDSVFNLLNNWIKTETQFPLPPLVREKLIPKTSEDDDGRDIASRIIGAISKFGYYNPSGAKEFIGEIGWEIVQRFGGWSGVCQLTYDELGIATAQMRDLAKTLKKKSMNGTIAVPVDFPNALPDGSFRHDAKAYLDQIPKNLLKKF